MATLTEYVDHLTHSIKQEGQRRACNELGLLLPVPGNPEFDHATWAHCETLAMQAIDRLYRTF